MADRFDLINFSKSVTTTLGGTTANVNIDANTLFVDGTNNRVGIGVAVPNATLDVVSSDRKRIRATGVSEEGVILFQNGTTGSGQSNGFLVGIGGDSNAYLLNFHNSPMIFSTNNGERMRIDASGRVTVPNQPMFWGVHNTTVTYNVGNLIQITAAYDPNSMFSGASNYRVTVPIAGRYLVSASLLLNTGSAGAFSVQIRKNGSNQRRIFSNQGYGYQHGSDTIILNCAANDYIDLAASDNTQTIYGADIGSFVVYLLG